MKRLPEECHVMRHCAKCDALTDHRIEYPDGGNTGPVYRCLPCDSLRKKGSPKHPKIAAKPAPTVATLVCPNCFLQVSLTGACGCF